MTTLKQKNNNEKLLKAITFLKLNLTYDELGEKLGYKKATISKYIKGTLPPSDDFLNKFQEVFKIDLDNIDIKKETKNPQPNVEGLKDKMILLLENALKRVEAELERALEENKRLNQK